MIKVWSTDTWTCERTLEDHTRVVISLAVYGDKLVSGSSDHNIKVWSTVTWACERTLEDHGGTVCSLMVHGDKLISGSYDSTEGKKRTEKNREQKRNAYNIICLGATTTTTTRPTRRRRRRVLVSDSSSGLATLLLASTTTQPAHTDAGVTPRN
jgi:WD40 repeat protein